VKRTREQVQIGSWYVLLDFARYLDQHLPPVWQVLQGQSVSLTPAQQLAVQPLVDWLTSTQLSYPLIASLTGYPSAYTPADVSASMAVALQAAAAAAGPLETVATPYDRNQRGGTSTTWPTFLFPLADPVFATNVPRPTTVHVDQLEALIAAALEAFGPVDVGPMPDAPTALQPVLDARGKDWFRVRCVFERPNCDPLTPPLVSEPSAAFEMAGFFDPDAPARPIRIGLPVDISPAGLRKFDRNTAFMISDALCGQLTKIRDHLTLGDLVLSVLPWPFHKDLPSEVSTLGGPCEEGGMTIGTICTLSLPIITIIALILLFVMVLLFNIIFNWLPLFFICFPLPRFRAKS